MGTSMGFALGFAVLRGIQLSALTVPWLLSKVRRAGTSESERSLVLMISSRSILLGVAIATLALMSKRTALGWVLVGDGLLQAFDAVHAIALLPRRKAALFPAVLCVLDGVAALILLG